MRLSPRRRPPLGPAVEAYVAGHDRGVEPERKLPAPDGDAAPEFEWGGAPPPPRFGVEVARRLDFHRGPDVWRSRAGRVPGDSTHA